MQYLPLIIIFVILMFFIFIYIVDYILTKEAIFYPEIGEVREQALDLFRSPNYGDNISFMVDLPIGDFYTDVEIFHNGKPCTKSPFYIYDKNKLFFDVGLSGKHRYLLLLRNELKMQDEIKIKVKKRIL